jgi:hypothetical protein
MERHRAGTKESLIAVAGIVKGRHDLHYLSGNFQQGTLTGWNERPPILSDYFRLSTCIPLNLADLHNSLKEQPNFAHRGRVDVAAKPVKKRKQFPSAPVARVGRRESTCTQQTAASPHNQRAIGESTESPRWSAESLALGKPPPSPKSRPTIPNAVIWISEMSQCQ